MKSKTLKKILNRIIEIDFIFVAFIAFILIYCIANAHANQNKSWLNCVKNSDYTDAALYECDIKLK